jgi:hypothetical protein
MAYCTIIHGRNGAPYRWYGDKETALRSATRRVRDLARVGVDETIDVVWARDGVPKVWLACVTPEGVQRTKHWGDSGSTNADGGMTFSDGSQLSRAELAHFATMARIRRKLHT